MALCGEQVSGFLDKKAQCRFGESVRFVQLDRHLKCSMSLAIETTHQGALPKGKPRIRITRAQGDIFSPELKSVFGALILESIRPQPKTGRIFPETGHENRTNAPF